MAEDIHDEPSCKSGPRPAIRAHADRASDRRDPCVGDGRARLEGHRWWCRCGRSMPWSGNIHSEHNSQHLVDPYSFTHMEHGLLLYALLRPFARSAEAGQLVHPRRGAGGVWEVVENSPAVIERYRQATIALGYVGDSVVNSLGDVTACAIGFFLAQRLPALVGRTLDHRRSRLAGDLPRQPRA